MGVEIHVVTHCRQHRYRDEFHEHLRSFFHDYASFGLVRCRDYIWFPSGCDLSGGGWRTGEWRYGSWIRRWLVSQIENSRQLCPKVEGEPPYLRLARIAIYGPKYCKVGGTNGGECANEQSRNSIVAAFNWISDDESKKRLKARR